MGFWDKLTGREEKPVSDDMQKARERHGIHVEKTEEKKAARRGPEKAGRGQFVEEPYDPWEELRNIRSNFWVGGWAAKRLRWQPSNDKLRAELEELEKKREEERQQKVAAAEASGDAALKAKLEEMERKREEKVRKRLEKEREKDRQDQRRPD